MQATSLFPTLLSSLASAERNRACVGECLCVCVFVCVCMWVGGWVRLFVCVYGILFVANFNAADRPRESRALKSSGHVKFSR